MMVLAPAVVGNSWQVPAATLAWQLTDPSLTVTVPVGVPLPGAAATTEKATVIAWPTRDGSGRSELIVVVVPAGLMSKLPLVALTRPEASAVSV